jgi:hypothetical protein
LSVSVNLSSPSVHQGAPDCVSPPIGSTKPIITLIILPLRVCILRSVTLLDLNMTLSALKDTTVVLARFPMILNPCVEAKLRVSSDWLVSSSKLQHYLELCRFTQVLRQKLQDEKRISFSESVKRHMCNVHQNGWRITRGTQPERKLLPLESHSYNKSHPSLRAYCFSKIDDQRHILVCIIFYLTFLNSTCLSFTSTQVYSLVHIYHRVILHHFLCSLSCRNLGMRFF